MIHHLKHGNVSTSLHLYDHATPFMNFIWYFCTPPHNYDTSSKMLCLLYIFKCIQYIYMWYCYKVKSRKRQEWLGERHATEVQISVQTQDSYYHCCFFFTFFFTYRATRTQTKIELQRCLCFTFLGRLFTLIRFQWF